MILEVFSNLNDSMILSRQVHSTASYQFFSKQGATTKGQSLTDDIIYAGWICHPEPSLLSVL